MKVALVIGGILVCGTVYAVSERGYSTWLRREVREARRSLEDAGAPCDGVLVRDREARRYRLYCDGALMTVKAKVTQQ